MGNGRLALERTAGSTRASLSPGALSFVDRDKFDNHLELLSIYVAAAGRDPKQWSSESLLAELVAALEDLEARLSAGEGQALHLYHEVTATVEAICRSAEMISPEAAGRLLRLADNCSDIMGSLESERTAPYIKTG